MVKPSSKPSSKSGSNRETAELLRWVEEHPPDSFASHSRDDVLQQEQQATRLWDDQVARDRASSAASPAAETADTEFTSTTASRRPRITSEELVRDILAALLELGVVSTWGNNLALQQNLRASDPVITRRIGILRLRFHPDSIPDSVAYRELVLLTSSGIQGLATTVTDFLRENQQE